MDFKSKESNTHRDELIKAREALSKMFAEREALEVEIAKQQRRVGALAALVNEGEEVDEILDLNLGGITDAVRSVFRASGPMGLTPVEIRERLTYLSFPVNEYKNFLASLHVVLDRLEKAGEIKLAILDKNEGQDRSVYQWAQKYQWRGRFRGRFDRNKRNE